MLNLECNVFGGGKEQKFRVNCAGPHVNVQALGMYVVSMRSFELPFVAKSITGCIRKEDMR